MRLETERLVLRRLSPEDVDELAPYFADPEVVRFLGANPRTREEVATSVEWFMRCFDLDGIGQFAVERKEDGVVLGRCGILNWETDPWRPVARTEATKPTETEIGYALGRPHWGKGYATEAAAAVRDYAQSELRRERIIALIHEDNVASRRVAEKLGMAYEREVELQLATVGLYSVGKRPAR